MIDLDPATIARELDRLGATLSARLLSVVELTSSTNDDARAAAQAGAPHGAVFIADAQNKGRGRGGHSWHSPPGENLYLSFLARPRLPPAAIAPITLAIGVGLAQAIEARLGDRSPLAIKWPNDVYVQRKKIAGILVEAQIQGSRLASLIVGVGVNVRTTSFPIELADRATSLALLGAHELDRSILAARIIAAIDHTLARFETERLASFLPELTRRDLLRGELVEIGELRGRGAGIDAEGRLLVDLGDSITALSSGEVGWIRTGA